jgi:hypothetical protein
VFRRVDICPIDKYGLTLDQPICEFGVHGNNAKRRREVVTSIDRRTFKRGMVACAEQEDIVEFPVGIDLVDAGSRNAAGEYIPGVRNDQGLEIGSSPPRNGLAQETLRRPLQLPTITWIELPRNRGLSDRPGLL